MAADPCATPAASPNPYTDGIARNGAETLGNPYSYSAIGSGNRPIAYVSWFDAARFVNWMHNGQGGVGRPWFMAPVSC